jgi:oxaloacetate decarboxylase alpha subunit
MTAIKAIEAGCDIVDTAISPLAMGTSQMPTEALVASLQDTEYDTGLNLKKLDAVAVQFTKLREKYLESNQLDPKVLAVNVKTLLYQVPGGMYSNLLSQLKAQGKSDKLNEVLEEVPLVRKDAGYPPLVTPTSQIVGTQAVMNVLSGERYKMVSNEFKALVRGEYGKTPVEIDPDFRRQIIGDDEPITCRPADLIEPELPKLREKLKDIAIQDEDILSYALFDQVAMKFFDYRAMQKLNLDGEAGDKTLKVHPV